MHSSKYCSTMKFCLILCGCLLSALVGQIESRHPLFEKILADKLNIKPHYVLHDIIPEIKFIPLKNFTACYDPSFGKTKLNIFKHRIVDIVSIYFTQLNHLFRPKTAIKRVENFVKNLKEIVGLIKECMRLPKSKQSKYGLTELSAYSYEEYDKQILNHDLTKNVSNQDDSSNQVKDLFSSMIIEKNRIFKVKTNQTGAHSHCNYKMNYRKLPNRFNWANLGVVSKIRNQGDCGNCFIFSALGSLESVYMIKHRNSSIELSVQAPTNCIKSACEGGMMNTVWDHVMKYGATYEKNARYVIQPKRCRFYPRNIEMTGYCFHVTSYTDDQIRAIIYKYGPAVAGIDANSRHFLHLKGPYKFQCGKSLNHAILIVGWTEKYWIIKNTWGENWGIKGYLYLPRNHNKCGINVLTGVPYV